MYKTYMDYSKEVEDALRENKPVVALESTIITHGMPYPDNRDMAFKVEDIIRKEGAIPATIAIIDGRIKVGLSKEEIETLSKLKGSHKVSRRDFSYMIFKKLTGGTTVASTMMICKMASIKFFVTGGIGGVHRGFNETMDVSADLEELSNTNVCVISAGIKAILDLPRTYEYLETKGVPVIGYQTDELPAFYSRSSGIKLHHKVDSIDEVATLYKTQNNLGLLQGMLIMNPIPIEHELPKPYMDEIIQKALLEAKRKNVTGKDVTPFLLEKIVKLTEGKSLKANLELVFNNAQVGAKIVSSYYKL